MRWGLVMSESIYIYPFGEKWRTFDAVAGVTKDHAKGVLNQGMTLRDHFAGLAMQGLLSADINNKWSEDDIAMSAYEQADAMLRERAIAIAKIGVE